MLADIHAVTRRMGRQHVVEKHKGPDAAAFTRGQGSQDRLAFYIFGARRITVRVVAGIPV